MCTEAVIDYLNWEVVTKVRVYSEIPIEFPVITVCNLNPWTGNASVDLMRRIYEEKNNKTFNESLTQIKNLADYRKYFEREAANPLFGDENRKKLGPTLDDMLLYCLFNNNECESSDFEWFYTIDYGNCFRFNSGKNASGYHVPKKFIQREGDWSALELDLFLPENQQMAEINYKRGVRVYIENSSYLHSTFANGIDVKPGTFTEIIMKKQITERLSKPYSNCQSSFPPEFASLPFLAGIAYREKDCAYLCIQRETIKRCNCFDSWYERIDDKTSPCLTEEEIICADSYFLDLYNNGKSKECAELCLPECYSVSYEATYSASNSPSRRYYDHTLKYNEFLDQSFRQEGIQNFTYENLRERFVSLKVYFNDLSYLKISELKKTTASDLVANIGNTFNKTLF
jgi:hypothetical protein